MSRVHYFAVLNIAWTCTRHELRSYFSKFGKVHSVKIQMNDSGFNRRIAFVKMNGDEGVTDGILKDYHIIDGQEVNIQLQDFSRVENIGNVTITRKL